MHPTHYDLTTDQAQSIKRLASQEDVGHEELKMIWCLADGILKRREAELEAEAEMDSFLVPQSDESEDAYMNERAA